MPRTAKLQSEVSVLHLVGDTFQSRSCRYNKPLLSKYEAAERDVQLKQQEIEKKIAGRRINQVKAHT